MQFSDASRVRGSGERLNVVLLTVDALRADRLSLYGYERPTSPALEALAANALVCDNAFTLAPFTQCGCIQIFTSSRPLMFGGYDQGARGRPQTVFQRFQQAGYKTAGLSTVHWVSPYYGYTGGLDDEYQLFYLYTLPGMAVGTMVDTLRLYREKKISAVEMTRKVTPIIYKLFDDADRYCEEQISKGKTYKTYFPESKLVNSGFNYNKVMKIIRRHRRMFERDGLAYIDHYLPEILDSERWLIRDWHYARHYRTLVCEAAFRLSNKAIRLFHPRLARMRDNRFKLCADARSIANRVISLIENRDKETPYFIWAHFKDTHHPYVAGHGRKWYKQVPDILASLGYSRELDPALTFSGKKPKTDHDSHTYSALYDAAVRSTDQEIGRIAETIDRLGLGDNTVIAICADHGDEIGEHGDHGHICLQYEHNVRVPMLFRRRGMVPRRTDSLVTLLDMAPTLAEIAGIQPAPDWEGRHVTSAAATGRDEVILETFCRGNCAFEHRPFYMAVRTKTHKYLWKEFRDTRDKFSPEMPELYDIEADPKEQNNLYRPDHPLVAEFNALIAKRLSEIPGISRDRIVAAFGEAIMTATEDREGPIAAVAPR